MRYLQSIVLALVLSNSVTAESVDENHRSATISGVLQRVTMQSIDLELTSTMPVHLSTCGSSIDTTISIAKIGSDNDWEQYYDDNNCDSVNEDICIELEAGQYIIEVYPFDSLSSSYVDYVTLTVSLDGCESYVLVLVIGAVIFIMLFCCCIAFISKLWRSGFYSFVGGPVPQVKDDKSHADAAPTGQAEVVSLAQQEGCHEFQSVQQIQLVPMQQIQNMPSPQFVQQPQYGQPASSQYEEQPQYAQRALNVQPPPSYAQSQQYVQQMHQPSPIQ